MCLWCPPTSTIALAVASSSLHVYTWRDQMGRTQMQIVIYPYPDWTIWEWDHKNGLVWERWVWQIVCSLCEWAASSMVCMCVMCGAHVGVSCSSVFVVCVWGWWVKCTCIYGDVCVHEHTVCSWVGVRVRWWVMCLWWVWPPKQHTACIARLRMLNAEVTDISLQVNLILAGYKLSLLVQGTWHQG